MRKGFEVVMAEDGQKGVDMSISENPDLILMDLSLPVMDGWEATSTIKNSEETLYWELSTAPGKKFRFKIDKLNNQAFISGSGYQGKWKKWKNAGDCSQN